MRIERLEERRLLSVINWVNRSVDDGFDNAFGENAAIARHVVDVAIMDWQFVIQNFNFADPARTEFELRLTAGVRPYGVEAGTLGLVYADSIKVDESGKPYSATAHLIMGAGDDIPPTEAPDVYKWFFAQRWANDFTSLSPDGYSGRYLAKEHFQFSFGPAFDFYSVVLHEIGHAVGFAKVTGLAINRYLTEIPGAPELYEFRAGRSFPQTTATFAGDVDFHLDCQSHPYDLMAGCYAIDSYLGWTYPQIWRSVISPLDARILRDAYGYTVWSPNDLVQPGELPPYWSTDCTYFSDLPLDEGCIIQAVQFPPTLDPIPDIAVDEGAVVTFQVTARDANPGQTVNFTLAPGAPDGTSINNATGIFRSTAVDESATGLVTIVVNDDAHLDNSDSFQLTVNNVAPAVDFFAVSRLENGPGATIKGAFRDPGRTDAHQVVVEWVKAGSIVKSTFALHATPHLQVNDSFTSTSDGSKLTVLSVVGNEAQFKIDAPAVDDTFKLTKTLLVVSDEDGGITQSRAPITGEFNGDRLVDRDDLAIWKAEFGLPAAPYHGANANGDGFVDGADLLAWQRNVGSREGVITVTSLEDNTAADGLITLREAIVAANTDRVADAVEGVQEGRGADVIVFDPSLFAAPRTIMLSRTLGEMEITSDLTITGPGRDLLIINANDPTPGTFNGDGMRIFAVDDGNIQIDKTVVLSGLTLTGGDQSGTGFNQGGGAISAREALTLESMSLIDNGAAVGGAVRQRNAPLVVIDAVFTNNVAAHGDGGAIYIDSTTPSVTLTTASLVANSASDNGGGIFQEGGTLTASNSTFSHNSAGAQGGGVYLTTSTTGNWKVAESLIDGNTAGADGGGVVQHGGKLELDSVTVTNNTAVLDAGGIDVLGAADILINESTVSGNTAAGDAGGIELDQSTGTLSIFASSISNNESSGYGGGILSEGAVTISGSEILENTAGNRGGGLALVTNDSTVSAAILDVTIAGNRALAGGGIFKRGGSMSLNDSVIVNNTATGFQGHGGGVYAVGAVTLGRSVVSGNRTTGDEANGGGIFSTGNVVVSGTTVSANSTIGFTAQGGGILAQGELSITDSTISGNFTSGESSHIAAAGAFGNLTVMNSTVSGNQTFGARSVSGGVSSDGTLAIYHSTITNNHANDSGANNPGGGGVRKVAGAVIIQNSMVAGNSSTSGVAPDLRLGTATIDVDYSLIGNTANSGLTPSTGIGNLLNVAPLLGPLANNGGPTLTHALLSGSPAINAGDPGVGNVIGTPEFDQRDGPFIRIINGRIDIGAVERQPQQAGFDADADTDRADLLAWHWRSNFGTRVSAAAQPLVHSASAPHNGPTLSPAAVDAAMAYSQVQLKLTTRPPFRTRFRSR